MNEGASADEPQQEGAWKPNPEFLQSLMNMGIQRAAAETALQLTGNQSAELAASFLFDNEEDWGAAAAASDDQVSQNRVQVDPLEDWTAPPVEVVAVPQEGVLNKMVFVVNAELQMGTGKVAAQVAHAALVLNRKLQYLSSSYRDAMSHWEETGNGGELKQLHEKADSLNVPACIIHDAGRTQVAPNSATVLGLFGPEKDVDDVTGSLPLL
ncbi:hypothetical protein B566_EDAN016472 [Ephemera danica]|nr:hypothetical protein B566_EDAN016472 [Ephemera danica]